jgi:hypothetical protein
MDNALHQYRTEKILRDVYKSLGPALVRERVIMNDNTISITESTYRRMRELGWCYPCKNGVCDLTPLGNEQIMKTVLDFYRRHRDDEPIREEWLAPN